MLLAIRAGKFNHFDLLPEEAKSLGNNGTSYISIPDDAEIIRRCREGDERAYRELIERYQRQVYSIALRMVRQAQDAEDLTQEFFYNFLRRDSLINVSPLAGKFRSYLLGCLKHFLANHRRDGTRRPSPGCCAR